MCIRDSSITAFPNPSKAKFTLLENYSSTEILIENISIYDIQGVLIKEIKSIDNSNNPAIDLSDSENGAYFLRLSYSDGFSRTLKILKI